MVGHCSSEGWGREEGRGCNRVGGGGSTVYCYTGSLLKYLYTHYYLGQKCLTNWVFNESTLRQPTIDELEARQNCPTGALPRVCGTVQPCKYELATNQEPSSAPVAATRTAARSKIRPSTAAFIGFPVAVLSSSNMSGCKRATGDRWHTDCRGTRAASPYREVGEERAPRR